MAEIRLEGIRHAYVAHEWALEQIDITWDDGGAYALLGPSGCGKTTMLDIISGLLRPTEGRVLFDGVDVTHQSPIERNIAQVFQFPVLYDSMTVEQNLRFPLRNRGWSKAEAQRRAEEVAELLEISHLLGERARGLTADAKQLVSLSRALVRREVSAILFDEPLTVIDPQKKWTLRQALKRVHTELSHTLVYVTHDQTEALTFADVVVVMNEGEILQRGTADELFERPTHRFVGHFIGSPGMNFLPCTVEDGVARVAGVDLLRLPEPPADTDAGADAAETEADADADGSEARDDVIGIRPDFVRCRSTPNTYTIPASVTAVRDLGAARLVYLTVRNPATAGKDEGDAEGATAGPAPESGDAGQGGASAPGLPAGAREHGEPAAAVALRRPAKPDRFEVVAKLPGEQPVSTAECWIELDPARLQLFRHGHLVSGTEPAVKGGAD